MLATSIDADFLSYGLVITVFTYFESLGQFKEARYEISTTISDLSMISAVGAVGISPQNIFFLELTTLKNLNLCNFGLKITNLACFEPIW